MIASGTNHGPMAPLDHVIWTLNFAVVEFSVTVCERLQVLIQNNPIALPKIITKIGGHLCIIILNPLGSQEFYEMCRSKSCDAIIGGSLYVRETRHILHCFLILS